MQMNLLKKALIISAVLFLTLYNINSFAASAKEFVGISNWLNSNPLTLEQLKGKVVLLEFWSHTCPNCLKSIPSVKKWDSKYPKDKLMIIGVHVPLRGANSLEDIKQAVAVHDIKYPVALDDKLQTTKIYNVHQLPTFYLIDQNGKVVYKTVGAGNYAALEKAIEKLINKN